MKIIWVIIVFLIQSTSVLFCQNLQYARKVIDTLSSPYFNGRGYVNNGINTAAGFIENEYQKYHLNKFNDNFFQSFSIPINTLPGKMLIEIDEHELIQVEDFIVSANTKSVKGKFELVWLDDLLQKDSIDFKIVNLKHKVLIVDTQSFNDTSRNVLTNVLKTQNIFQAEAVIFLTNEVRLSWDISNASDVSDYLTITLKKKIISKNAKSIKINIDARFIKKYPVKNVIGYVKGKQFPDSFLVFTAHYDHLGRMGKNTYFPGAHDNASGTATMLDLAHYYSLPEHQPDYSIAFMSFCCEEIGLLGSWYYTEHPLFPLSKIKFLINLDILGTGSEGIQIVNSLANQHVFDRLNQINSEKKYLPEIKPRGNAPDSDHYYFTQKKVPAIFIYTLGKEYLEYHTVNDKAAGLPLTKYDILFHLITDLIQTFK